MPADEDEIELLRTRAPQVPECGPWIRSPGPVIVDVRRKGRDRRGDGAGGQARSAPAFLELRIEETVPDRGADVVL